MKIRLFLTIIQLLFIVSFSSISAQSISAGGNHSLYKCSGTVSCGRNTNGQLGDGSTVQKSTAVDVGNVSSVTKVSAGAEHSLVLQSNYTVKSFGRNNQGQLGLGHLINQPSPGTVTGGFIDIAAGSSHSLFLKFDGTVSGAGSGLPIGNVSYQSFPVQIPGLTGIISLAAGVNYSLFLKSDGTVWAVGGNTDGQLGDGTTTYKISAIQVSGLSGIIAIQAGASHSLFLKNDSTVWAVGLNSFGQLGDGTTTNKSVAIQINGLSGITSIDAGGYHSLALKNDGTVWAWGGNEYGKLGDGTLINRSIPTQVSSLTGIAKISGGGNHSLFVKNNGEVWGAGLNDSGQLGDGTTTNKLIPVLSILTELTTTEPTTFCQGGAVTLNPGPGSWMPSYIWSNGATTQSVTVTSSGNYSTTATDPYNGCVVKSTVQTVTVNSLPTATIVTGGTTTLCNGGTKILTTTSGMSSYLWSNGATTQSTTISSAGEYFVTVTDGNGCINKDSVLISIIYNIAPNATVDFPTCIGGNIKLYSSPNGGDGAYIYNWTGPSNFASTLQNPIAANATNLNSGNYIVKITDGNGCKNSDTVSVSVTQVISLNLSTNSPACIGGLIELGSNPTGGTVPYAYVWSGPNGFNSTLQNPVIDSAGSINNGSYSLTVTDNNGCMVSNNQNVTVAQIITINTGSNSPACLYGDIYLTSIATGGTGNYTYNWINDYLYTSTLQNPSMIGIGSYPNGGFNFTVTIADSLGCTNSKSVPVTFFNWNVNLNSSNASLCSAPCNGLILSNVISGGHSPYQYSWSNGDTGTTQISGLCPANYILTIANTDGTCPKSFSKKLESSIDIDNEVGLVNIACVSQMNVPAEFANYYAYDLPASINSHPSNPNNFVDPGKIVRFKVQCNNNKLDGQSIVSGMCKVRCNSPYATLTDSTAALNNIAWGLKAWSADEFEIQLSNNIPEGAVFYFDFIVAENGNEYITGCLPIPVWPLVYSTNNLYTVDDDSNPDSQGNSDGIIDPNEIVEFYPWLNNVSPYSADNTYGQLRNLDNFPYVNIWENVQGVNTVVRDHSWWNFGFGQPQSIPIGAVDMKPEFDFVFKYNSSNPNNDFKLYTVLASGFNLFSGNALSLLQWSLPYTFNNTSAVSIGKELEINNDLSVYPNPTKHFLIVEGDFKELINITLTDVAGKLVFKQTENGMDKRYLLDTESLTNGMYLLKIQGATQHVIRKINISH